MLRGNHFIVSNDGLVFNGWDRNNKSQHLFDITNTYYDGQWNTQIAQWANGHLTINNLSGAPAGSQLQLDTYVSVRQDHQLFYSGINNSFHYEYLNSGCVLGGTVLYANTSGTTAQSISLSSRMTSLGGGTLTSRFSYLDVLLCKDAGLGTETRFSTCRMYLTEKEGANRTSHTIDFFKEGIRYSNTILLYTQGNTLCRENATSGWMNTTNVTISGQNAHRGEVRSGATDGANPIRVIAIIAYG